MLARATFFSRRRMAIFTVVSLLRQYAGSALRDVSEVPDVRFWPLRFASAP